MNNRMAIRFLLGHGEEQVGVDMSVKMLEETLAHENIGEEELVEKLKEEWAAFLTATRTSAAVIRKESIEFHGKRDILVDEDGNITVTQSED